MKVLFFATEEACLAGLEMINATFRAMAAGAGYELDETGNIIGKDWTGFSEPASQVTETWDTPHAVGDGTVSVSDEVTMPIEWFIADPSINFDPIILTGVIDYAQGEYQYPPEPDE